MRIINETVYNSTDLYNLFHAVDRLCSDKTVLQAAKWKAEALAKGEPWEERSWHRPSELPKAVRFGYRTKPRVVKADPGSSPARKKRIETPAFVSVRSRYTDSPRFGIVKPTDLPLNPLVILAHCADGANRALPKEVIRSLAMAFARTRRGGPSADDYNLLAENYQITFSLNVEKGAKAEAKEARKVARIANLKEQIECEQGSLNRLYLKGEKHRKKIASFKEKLAKLEPQQGMRMYV